MQTSTTHLIFQRNTHCTALWTRRCWRKWRTSVPGTQWQSTSAFAARFKAYSRPRARKSRRSKGWEQMWCRIISTMSSIKRISPENRPSIMAWMFCGLSITTSMGSTWTWYNCQPSTPSIGYPMHAPRRYHTGPAYLHPLLWIRDHNRFHYYCYRDSDHISSCLDWFWLGCHALANPTPAGTQGRAKRVGWPQTGSGQPVLQGSCCPPRYHRLYCLVVVEPPFKQPAGWPQNLWAVVLTISGSLLLMTAHEWLAKKPMR